MKRGLPQSGTDGNQVAHLLANRSETLVSGSLIRAVRVYFFCLRKRLIKTGARLVRHARAFAAILTMINALLGPPQSEVLT